MKSADKEVEADAQAPSKPATQTGSIPVSGQRFFAIQRVPGRLPGIYLIASLLLAVAAGTFFSIDGSSDFTLESLDLPGDIEKAVHLSEAFAHGIGAAVILITIWVVADRRRPHIWLAILMTLSSSLVANGMKAFFVRVRPHSAEQFQVTESDGSLFLADSTKSPEPTSRKTNIEASFWDSRQRSFPSGHAATATSLALGLTLVFPRGVWIFAMLATMACVQRILSEAHYPSDVLAGCAIAFACCGLILGIHQRLHK